jgi:HD-GYP domain-containing protein (c-di-GMP phosphodiesterase class II)
MKAQLMSRFGRVSEDMSHLHKASHFKVTVLVILFCAVIFRIINEMRFPEMLIISDSALLISSLIALAYLWVQELKDRERLLRLHRKVLKAQDREDCELVESLLNFVLSIEKKYPYMNGHANRVSYYARAIAEQLNLPGQEIESVKVAGLLHDIGNGAIPDRFLAKEEPLTEHEWSAIMSHPLISYSLLSHVGVLQKEAKIVRHHHERFDGKGYPDQLKGDQIELGARILAVAEAFEAMTTPRTYRADPISPQSVRHELIRNAGLQFDPLCVNALLFFLQQNPKPI